MANRYGIAVDYRRCVGCGSCAVSCKMENNVPNEVWYLTVNTLGGKGTDTPAGEYGSNTINYQPFHCQHCDKPICAEVCPVGATYKDEDTGIVMQDIETCIGCRSCIEVCPYMAVGAGVRTYVDAEPEFLVGFPVGNQVVPNHKANVTEKCTLCHQRVTDGGVPSCVESCPTYARTFGDLNDPESALSVLLAGREHEQILPDSGTGPNMFYLL